MQNNRNKRSKTNLALLLLLLLHAIAWLVLKPVAPRTDDLCYMQEADALIQGHYHLSDSPKNHRLGIIVPAAFFISVFGKSSFAVSLWPLLCSFFTIAALYFLLVKYSGQRVAFIASFLLTFNITQLTSSAVLFPDVIVSLFAFLAATSVFFGRTLKGKEKQYGVLFSFFFFTGFLCKEIILLILPFIFIIFISDTMKKKNILFWKVTAPVFSLCTLTMILAYHFLTGDILFLYHSVEKNHNTVFAVLSSEELIKRITWLPAVWIFVQPGYFPLLLLSAPAFIKRQKSGILLFYSKYAAVLLATMWVGSSSFSHWAPMLLLDRMWMLLLAPLCMLAAFVIDDYILKAEFPQKKFLPLLFLLAGLIATFSVSLNRGIAFFIFGFSFAAAHLLKTKTAANEKIVTAVLLIPYLVLTEVFLYFNSRWL